MRVISGAVRGLKLVSPEGINTRPTLDRVKEAVFSMLLPYINDAVVLDLFAGSGAMGIEALSRGAEFCQFIDRSADAISCIKSNIASAKMKDRSSVFQCDSIDYLKSCDRKFDLIFLDPPYSADLYKSVLSLILKNEILSQDALLVAEWDYDKGFLDDIYGFELVKEKKYGRVGISVLKRG